MDQPAATKITTSVQLTDRQDRYVADESKRLGISRSDVIRRVLDAQIDRAQQRQPARA